MTTQERFPNKSMLMTGTNNKLRFRINKTLFNNTPNTKLYLDKKGVSYTKGKMSKLRV